MSRINNNINSLIAQRVTGQQNAALSKSLERLSTGLRINRGGDDPAGLIASEVLRGEKAALTSAIGNAERAEQFVATAEGGLQEINALLTEVQSLVGQSANEAGLSQEEKEANQLQIDNILTTIDRIASTTSFQGTKLLNGNFDFQVSSVAATVDSLNINDAKLGSDNVAVQALVTQSAQNAGVFLSLGDTSLDLTSAVSSFVFELGGAEGTREFSFGSGATLADMATQINTFKDVTGVSAVASGDYLELKSTEFGEDAFVSFNITNDGGQTGGVVNLCAVDTDLLGPTATNFTAITAAIRDEGQDLAGTINGIAARGDGKTLSVSSDALAAEVTLTTAGAQATGSTAVATIYGGGAEFNLGAEVNLNNQVRLGIGSVAARELGQYNDGTKDYFLDDLGSSGDLNVVDGDLTDAQKVIDQALREVSGQRGRLGAFQKNVVGSTINSLSVAFENISAAESAIRDTDFAEATAELARNQVLVAAANQVLGIANSQTSQALTLL
ncbi:MAG: flagellin [Phycisphaeraceae bacterium]|nr:flagellin [Phycisphaeraceae bacterium]